MNEVVLSDFNSAISLGRSGGVAISGSKFSRAAIIGVFELNGGIDAFSTWAKENESEFYTKLFGKMVGREETLQTEDDDVEQLLTILDAEYEDTTPPPVEETPAQSPEDARTDDLGYANGTKARLARRALMYARSEPTS